MLINLKCDLMKRCISQLELARRLGVSESNLSKMINGWRPMPEELKQEICRLLKVDREEIFPIDVNE